MDSFKWWVTLPKSSFDEPLGGLIGFPILITIFVKNGIKNLNLTNLFELMAKRIAVKNNIYYNKSSFWIFKKLKRRGYIAGKYEICISESCLLYTSDAADE